MKKFKSLLLTMGISFLLLLPSNAFAAGGTWDLLGSESLSAYKGTVTINNSKYWSGGGNYKVHVSGADPATQVTVTVYEDDPDGSTLVYCVLAYGDTDIDFPSFSTEEYVDGTNGKAELRFEITRSQADAITVSFYD